MQINPLHANYLMKTDVMFRRVLTVLGFAAALALPAGPARAQSPAAPQAMREDPRRAGQPPSSAPAQYDLEIENSMLRLGDRAKELAKLGSIVRLLRDKHPEANIAMTPELGEIVIPDLKLRAASVDDELEALRVASGDKFVWRAFDNQAQPKLFTLQPSEQFLRESAVSRPTQLEVFNMTSYFARQANAPANEAALADYKGKIIDDSREIISNTVQWACPRSGFIQLQFHPGANLLVVVGTPDSIEVARKIINAMIGQPDAPRAGESTGAVDARGKVIGVSFTRGPGKTISVDSQGSIDNRFLDARGNMIGGALPPATNIVRVNPDGSIDYISKPAPPDTSSNQRNQ